MVNRYSLIVESLSAAKSPLLRDYWLIDIGRLLVRLISGDEQKSSDEYCLCIRHFAMSIGTTSGSNSSDDSNPVIRKSHPMNTA